MNCPTCGRNLSHVEDRKYCDFCGTSIDGAETPGAVPSRVLPSEAERALSVQPPSHEEYSPWEDPEHIGFLRGMMRTIVQSLFHPHRFFLSMPREGGLVQPLLYALIVGTAGSMAGLFWAVIFDTSLIPRAALVGENVMFIGPAIPIVVVISVILWAVILHSSLFLLGGANRNFEATARLVCYSSGADLFNIIPIIGGFIAMVWRTVIIIMGLVRVHGISSGRAVAALVVPVIVLLVGISFMLGMLFLVLSGSS